jgi:hypothetical protein
MNDSLDAPLWLRWWPGLPEIWRCGDRTSLFVAIGFATALNVSIVSYGVWPQMLPEPVRFLWTVGVAAIWGLCVARPHVPSANKVIVDEKEWDRGLFIEAQGEYLKGHWFEAESILVKWLGDTPADDAARLLLTSVFRRAGQFQRALAELDQICDVQAWKWEIQQERTQIGRSTVEQNDPTLENELSLDLPRDGIAAMAEEPIPERRAA